MLMNSMGCLKSIVLYPFRDSIIISTGMFKPPARTSCVIGRWWKPFQRCISKAHDSLSQVIKTVHQMRRADLIDIALKSTVIPLACHILISISIISCKGKGWIIRDSEVGEIPPPWPSVRQLIGPDQADLEEQYHYG